MWKAISDAAALLLGAKLEEDNVLDLLGYPEVSLRL